MIPGFRYESCHWTHLIDPKEIYWMESLKFGWQFNGVDLFILLGPIYLVFVRWEYAHCRRRWYEGTLDE